MTDISVSQQPEFPSGAEVSTPTGQLRFVERTELTQDHTDVIVKRILQQQITTLVYRDGKPFSRTFEWHDVPLVKDEATKLDA